MTISARLVARGLAVARTSGLFPWQTVVVQVINKGELVFLAHFWPENPFLLVGTKKFISNQISCVLRFVYVVGNPGFTNTLY